MDCESKGPAGLSRRDFQKLAMAALGGMLAGAGAGAGAEKDDAKPQKKDPKKPLFLQEPHICRGLNTCKNKGRGGKNACAGQSACHTTKEHTCSGDNECAGQGGCGATPGMNACKGKGECGVPLSKKAWAAARKIFESQMKKARKKFGKPAEK
jgi:hypothetical protein